jgi:outer membrane protein OmpA-like peptidoglycan-associated protein
MKVLMRRSLIRARRRIKKSDSRYLKRYLALFLPFICTPLIASASVYDVQEYALGLYRIITKSEVVKNTMKFVGVAKNESSNIPIIEDKSKSGNLEDSSSVVENKAVSNTEVKDEYPQSSAIIQLHSPVVTINPVNSIPTKPAADINSDVIDTAEPQIAQPVAQQHNDVDIKYTTYFDFMSTSVNIDEMSNIVDDINVKASDTKTVYLYITGYTSKTGSKKVNDLIAKKRADSVYKFLYSSLGSRFEYIVDGLGKCCYLGKDNNKNRRVEIEFKTKKNDASNNG